MGRTAWFIASPGMTRKDITYATILEILIAYQGGQEKIVPKVRKESIA